MICVRFLEETLKKFAPDELHVGQVPRSRGKSDSGYVLAIWGRPDTLLNVHIDTVPSGEGWTDDPLNLRREADRVIGLGTSDIKGAAACILAALETVTPKNAAVLFSGDEEHGSEVMPAVIASRRLSDVKRAIVCEPTSCRVGRAHRGMLAISAEGLCVNIGEIESDGAYNVIPTTAKLWLSLRPPPGDNVRARETDIYALADGAELDTIVAFEPFATKNMSAFAAMLSEAGINTVVYGPGNLEQAHKPNEYVEIAQLESATKIYAAALQSGLS